MNLKTLFSKCWKITDLNIDHIWGAEPFTWSNPCMLLLNPLLIWLPPNVVSEYTTFVLTFCGIVWVTSIILTISKIGSPTLCRLYLLLLYVLSCHRIFCPYFLWHCMGYFYNTYNCQNWKSNSLQGYTCCCYMYYPVIEYFEVTACKGEGFPYTFYSWRRVFCSLCVPLHLFEVGYIALGITVRL